jgi:hypothetical protein
MSTKASFLAKVLSNAWAAMLLIIAVFALQVPARADAVLLSEASAQIGPFSNPICQQQAQNLDGSAPSQAQCLGNLSGGTTYNVLGYGSASFGRLGVLDSVDLHNVTPLEFPGVAVSGFASFSDTLTFSVGSTALFPFTVTGNGGGFLGKVGDFLQVVSVPPAEILTFSYPITPGIPVAIDFVLRAGDPSHFLPLGCPFQTGPPCDIQLTSDLSDTAALGPVQVLDSLGNPLTGVTITSESGFDYSRGAPPESAVPEPGTLLVTTAGCILLLFLRSTRGKADKSHDGAVCCRSCENAESGYPLDSGSPNRLWFWLKEENL